MTCTGLFAGQARSYNESRKPLGAGLSRDEASTGDKEKPRKCGAFLFQ